MAEVGWTPQEIRNWDDFNQRLTRYHYDRMSNMGIAFRLPFPDVKFEDGALRVKLPYEWAVVRFTSDESEPTRFSPVYKGEIFTDKPLKYRFATFWKDDYKSISVKASNIHPEFQTPETTVETNLEGVKNSFTASMTDYKPGTYFRSNRKLAAGDYVTYRFKTPVRSSKITIETGIPNIDFYWITDGYVEYSYDGVNFIKGDNFNRGKAVIVPARELMAVRLMVTAPNDAHTAAFQDLKIEK
jgi:hexosaminidase